MVVSIVVGFIAGILGSEVYNRFIRTKKLNPVTEVVRRVGPSLYVSQKKRKPITHSDFDLWKIEQEQKN